MVAIACHSAGPSRTGRRCVRRPISKPVLERDHDRPGMRGDPRLGCRRRAEEVHEPTEALLHAVDEHGAARAGRTAPSPPARRRAGRSHRRAGRRATPVVGHVDSTSAAAAEDLGEEQGVPRAPGVEVAAVDAEAVWRLGAATGPGTRPPRRRGSGRHASARGSAGCPGRACRVCAAKRLGRDRARLGQAAGRARPGRAARRGSSCCTQRRAGPRARRRRRRPSPLLASAIVDGPAAGDVLGVVFEQALAATRDELVHPRIADAVDDGAVLAAGGHEAAPAQARGDASRRWPAAVRAGPQLAGGQLARPRPASAGSAAASDRRARGSTSPAAPCGSARRRARTATSQVRRTSRMIVSTSTDMRITASLAGRGSRVSYSRSVTLLLIGDRRTRSHRGGRCRHRRDPGPALLRRAHRGSPLDRRSRALLQPHTRRRLVAPAAAPVPTRLRGPQRLGEPPFDAGVREPRGRSARIPVQLPSSSIHPGTNASSSSGGVAFWSGGCSATPARACGPDDRRARVLVDAVGRADIDIDEADVGQRGAEFGLGERASDAAGPLLRVSARASVHALVGNHVGDGEATWAQDPGGLGEHDVLVGGEVDDAVGDDDVDGGVGERDVLEVAPSEKTASKTSSGLTPATERLRSQHRRQSHPRVI